MCSFLNGFGLRVLVLSGNIDSFPDWMQSKRWLLNSRCSKAIVVGSTPKQILVANARENGPQSLGSLCHCIRHRDVLQFAFVVTALDLQPVFLCQYTHVGCHTHWLYRVHSPQLTHKYSGCFLYKGFARILLPMVPWRSVPQEYRHLEASYVWKLLVQERLFGSDDGIIKPFLDCNIFLCLVVGCRSPVLWIWVAQYYSPGKRRLIDDGAQTDV